MRMTKFSGYSNPLSHLRFSRFKLEGVEYNSVQQFLTMKKCQLAGDKEAEAQAKTSNPCQCRALKINGLDEDKWKEEVSDLLQLALKHKFIQNTGPRKYLLKTGDSKLLFCDHEDPFLGTGFPLIDSHQTYPGKNLLGEILMETRSELMKNPGYMEEIAETGRKRKQEAEEAVDKKLKIA